MRIAFVGKAGSGKTTMARGLVKNYSFKRMSFAKPLKLVAQKVIFWRPLDKKIDRTFLQMFGDGARHSASNVWIRHFEWQLRQLEEEGVEHFVVDDCRYLNEAQFLRDNGFIVIYLVGRGYDLPEEEAKHPSEIESDLIRESYTNYEVDSTGTIQQTWRNLEELLHKLDTLRK